MWPSVYISIRLLLVPRYLKKMATCTFNRSCLHIQNTSCNNIKRWNFEDTKIGENHICCSFGPTNVPTSNTILRHTPVNHAPRNRSSDYFFNIFKTIEYWCSLFSRQSIFFKTKIHVYLSTTKNKFLSNYNAPVFYFGRYEKNLDDYNAIMVKAIADRLAEVISLTMYRSSQINSQRIQVINQT